MKKEISKNKIKLSVLLSIAIMVFAVGLSMISIKSKSDKVFADEETYLGDNPITINGLTYYYTVIDNENNYVAIFSNITQYMYDNDESNVDFVGNITIPSTFIDNDVTYTVTEIGESGFYFCDNITSITLPNTITAIGVEAFCECHNLTSINIPYGVIRINEFAFANCWSTIELNIPNTVTSIGDEAFSGCNILKSLIISNSINTMGNDVFAYTELQEIWTQSNKSLQLPYDYTWGPDSSSTYQNHWYEWTLENGVATKGNVEYDNSTRDNIKSDNVHWKHFVNSYFVDDADVVKVTCDASTEDVMLEDKGFWTLSGNNKIATKLCVVGCPYGELPQGANGKPISWKNGNSKVKANTLVTSGNKILNGYVPTFPNTGVSANIIVPTMAIVGVSVIGILSYISINNKRKIIVKK